MPRSIPVRVAALIVLGAGVLSAAGAVAFSDGEESHATPQFVPAPELAATLAAQATDPSVEAILADGVVTQEEYDESIQRTAACLSPLRIELAPRGNGQPGFTADSPADLDAAVAASAIRECTERHLSLVGRVRVAQNRPTAEQVARLISAVDACLASAGWAQLQGLSDWDVTEKYGDDSEQALALGRCVAEARAR